MTKQSRLFAGLVALAFAALTISDWRGWNNSPLPLWLDKLAISLLLAFGLTLLIEYAVENRSRK